MEVRYTHVFFDTVLRDLPEWCIKEIVEAYRTKGPEKELAKRTAIILHRDSYLKDKLMVAKHFINYCKSKEDSVNAENLEMLKAGTTPKYWFLECSEEHSARRRICDSSKLKFNSIRRMYQHAVKLYVKRGSAVAEDVIATEGKQNKTYVAKTSAIGRNNFSSQ